MEDIRILPAGDLSLIVEFGNEISKACNDKVRQLHQSLKQNKLEGIVETIPTFRSLLIYYNPEIISYKKLSRQLKAVSLAGEVTKDKIKRIIELPVCYGGKYGEDLSDVAEHVGMTEAEVVHLHSKVDYLIYMLGFLPGFPYLGGLDKRLETPRLSNPRTSISAGAVGIGGEQTGVYPIASPGGWRLIGRTPVKLYDSEREKPILYETGDYIRFKPIDEQEYEAIDELANRGMYQCIITMKGVEE